MLRSLLFLCIALSCSVARAQHWTDLADVPQDLRQPNWIGTAGEGSCFHASIVSALNWLGQDEMAAWWKQTYSNGEYARRALERLDAAGLRYVFTQSGDIAVLEYAARNRLIVTLPYKPYHAINLVDLTATHAVLLDNNSVGQFEYVPRAEFEQRWRQEFGGIAIVLLGTPAPPWPRTP